MSYYSRIAMAIMIFFIASCQSGNEQVDNADKKIKAEPVVQPTVIGSEYELAEARLFVRDDSGKKAEVSADVFFLFDESILKPEYFPILAQHAKFLGLNPEQSIRIAGHTDDLGTREYNLALGSQRSEVVKSFLLTRGVNSSQIDTVSYGEEIPFVLGHYEAAWKENRRAVISYQ